MTQKSTGKNTSITMNGFERTIPCRSMKMTL